MYLYSHKSLTFLSTPLSANYKLPPLPPIFSHARLGCFNARSLLLLSVQKWQNEACLLLLLAATRAHTHREKINREMNCPNKNLPTHQTRCFFFLFFIVVLIWWWRGTSAPRSDMIGAAQRTLLYRLYACTGCSLNIVFFLKCCDFSELCQFCCAGVWPTIVYTHWHWEKTEFRIFLKIRKKHNI